MKKILLFGSKGQLGWDLHRLLKDSYEVLAMDREELDVTDESSVVAKIKEVLPYAVINASAYNKVEQAESETKEAFAVNAFAPFYMAKGSAEVNAIFFHVSTDYVFDGSKEFFYENDAVHPLNAYGVSKESGEWLVRSRGQKNYIVRTSAVFGVKESNQKLNFVDRMISLAKEGQVLKVVSDQFTSPTYSYDLALKIKELLEKPAPFTTYHVTNSGSCSWYEFAVKILELMNLDAKVEPVKSDFSGGKVNRPKRSVLKSLALEQAGLNLLPSWEDALLRYLNEKYKGQGL